ncbi:Bromodomain-containing protein [Lobosporangium transversale]|uniref:Bromodomain-containing protein n=1 Tax=Lobosporangium transversale TaxID=64571 RepID=A0A1Y2H383_9FUNG|nr:Bromodomain-containing protein [Lobosporangium transversale]ORZ27532.1 Bromodomain-containing protein [Lobosporangium transversale]|eukprot:XP_021885259.1 Bromodomain-containing protein [Lobosporangium transversale]
MPPTRKKSTTAKGTASIVEGLSFDNKEETMAEILGRLENLKDKSGRSISELFLTLPEQEDYPDYYMIIKSPIAFDMIRDRLKAGQYAGDNLDDFGKDLKTMISNAKTYNREGSMVYRDATVLESYIDAVIKALKGDSSHIKIEFSPEFCQRVLDTIKYHEDKDGRQVAELFMELPSKDDYPDYYDEISKPIAINIIEEKIARGEYTKMELFEKDMNQMFDNAKIYNAEGSEVYSDAETLQHLFWKTIGKNGRGRHMKGKVQRKHNTLLPEIVHQGETYRVGDFVHIQNDVEPSKPTIGIIFSIWQDDKGINGIDAAWFLRPEHIVHPYASRFYPSEVVKSSGTHEHLVSDILGRCYVLQTKDYIRGRPVGWKEGQYIYVCEQRYNESYKSVSKIKNWANCLPPGHKPGDIELKLYPQPLVIKKLPGAARMNKTSKRGTSEPVSRASSPRDYSSAYATSREATQTPEPELEPESEPEPEPKPKPKPKPKLNLNPNPNPEPEAELEPKPEPKPEPKVTKTSKAMKRKSAQMLGESSPSMAPLEKKDTTPVRSQPRLSSPPQHRYRCNYSNLSTKLQCAA